MGDLFAVAIEVDLQHFVRIEIGQIKMAVRLAWTFPKVQAIEQSCQFGHRLVP